MFQPKPRVLVCSSFSQVSRRYRQLMNGLVFGKFKCFGNEMIHGTPHFIATPCVRFLPYSPVLLSARSQTCKILRISANSTPANRNPTDRILQCKTIDIRYIDCLRVCRHDDLRRCIITSRNQGCLPNRICGDARKL